MQDTIFRLFDIMKVDLIEQTRGGFGVWTSNLVETFIRRIAKFAIREYKGVKANIISISSYKKID